LTEFENRRRNCAVHRPVRVVHFLAINCCILYAVINNSLYERCRKLTWPHLKNSTVGQYEYLFTAHLLPRWGETKLKE